MTNLSGSIIYEGASMIDGAPIVAIAIPESRNDKAGGLLQVFVMRSDISPLEALASGKDKSVCGNCVARPANGDFCYVVVAQSVNQVWKTYKRLPVIRKGKPTGKNFKGYAYALTHREITEVGRGHKIRKTAYGDGGAVPFEVWESLMYKSRGGNGYTHQWRGISSRYAQYFMAWCNSPSEVKAAEAKGYRAFLMRTAEDPIPENTAICPADKIHHGKMLANCGDCMGCGGLKGKGTTHRAIIAHGAKHKIRKYQEWRAAND